MSQTTVRSNLPKKSQLVPLTSIQLNQINGGAGNPSGPEPNFGPDGYRMQ